MRLTSYLQKPYSPLALGKLVRSVLDQHAQANGSRGKGSYEF